jgi:hypothetical protein
MVWVYEGPGVNDSVLELELASNGTVVVTVVRGVLFSWVQSIFFKAGDFSASGRTPAFIARLIFALSPGLFQSRR